MSNFLLHLQGGIGGGVGCTGEIQCLKNATLQHKLDHD